jgi:hypothetical protein
VATSDPTEIVAELESKLSLPVGFLRGLVNEPDWSFVIKAHAFLEAVLAHSLAEALSNEDLRPVFANLDTSDPKRGKLAFIKALGIITHEDRRYLTKLSELRNLLVHDVAFTGIDLRKHFKALDPPARKEFVEAFAYAVPEEGVDLDGKTYDRASLLEISPKVVIWAGLMAITARAYALAKAAQLGEFLAVIEFYQKKILNEAA